MKTFNQIIRYFIKNQKRIGSTAYMISFAAFLLLFTMVAINQSNASQSATPSAQLQTQSQSMPQGRVAQVVYELNGMILGNPETNDPGALVYASNLIEYLYTHPPASTGEYVNYLAQKVQPEPVYATDSGFQALNPLTELWKSSLSAALFMATVVFIVIGFMIMFRKKISPQTVATVQGALPGVIIAIIIMYLSYGIVGAILDFSNIVTNASVSLFATGRASDLNSLRNTDLFRAFHFGELFTPIRQQISGVVVSGITGDSAVSTQGTLNFSLFGSPISFEGFSFGKAIVGALGAILGFIGALVISIALLTTVFRVFFALLTAYASIVIYTILGPLQIVLGGIPGQSRFISTWFKEVLANALIFPAVFTILMFAAIIGGVNSDPWRVNQGVGVVDWNAPLIEIPGSGVNALIALGLLLMAPKVPDTVKKALGAEGGFANAAASAGFTNIPFIGPYAKSER